jgi:hypothetical protein
MVGRDPSRFDYLFEPLDGGGVGVADDDVPRSAVPAPELAKPRRSLPSLMLIMATVAGACLGAAILLSRPADAGQAPTEATTPAPTTVVVTSAPTVESPPPAPVPVVAVTPLATPSQLPAPVRDELPPPPPPPPTTPEPTRVADRTPAVRAPMSVSPKPRPAFPNQRPGTGSNGRGGLLGLGGLL